MEAYADIAPKKQDPYGTYTHTHTHTQLHCKLERVEGEST